MTSRGIPLTVINFLRLFKIVKSPGNPYFFYFFARWNFKLLHNMPSSFGTEWPRKYFYFKDIRKDAVTDVPLYFFKGENPQSVKLGSKSSWPDWFSVFQNLSSRNMYFPYGLMNEPMSHLAGLTKEPVYCNNRALGQL